MFPGGDKHPLQPHRADTAQRGLRGAHAPLGGLKKKDTGNPFRSGVLGVMSPARFRCAMPVNPTRGRRTPPATPLRIHCASTAQRGLRGTHVPLGGLMSPSSFCKAGELKYYHPQVSILCLPFNEKEITVGMVGPHGSIGTRRRCCPPWEWSVTRGRQAPPATPLRRGV